MNRDYSALLMEYPEVISKEQVRRRQADRLIEETYGY